MAASLPAHAAGTLPIALAQQIDINGQPLANCQVKFFVAGTPATPQNAYGDFGLTQQLPNPLSCDQTGRVPMFWLADGLIHVQMIDANGLVIIDTTMQVLGPSSGGGGGGGSTVDPTTIFATGDIKARYSTGSLTGFVRLNGLTIGNATSGASERANTDTQNLFVYLWNTDANLVVSGGRGANGLADFNGGKTIALPDWRGYALAALGDMGNSATGVLTQTYANCQTGNPTTLGSTCGTQSFTLLAAHIPPINSANNSQNISVTGNVSVSGNVSGNVSVSGTVTVNSTIADIGASPSSMADIGVGGSGNRAFAGSSAFLTQVQSTGNNTLSGNNTLGGSMSGSNTLASLNTISTVSTNTGGQAHPTVTPEKLATFYMKL